MKYITGSKEVILVDPKDKVLGMEDVFVAHQYPLKLHRAISVFLFKKIKGQVFTLLQQRSQYKIWPFIWPNAVCGNVAPGEDYLACAKRRLRQELGIKDIELNLGPKIEYQAEVNEEFGEHEMDQLFWAEYEEKINPNPQEVKTYAWVPWQEFKTRASKLKNPQHPVELEFSGKKYLVAPWSLILAPHLRDF